jgi:glycolate oxidase FAD binding subunit
LTLSVEAGIPLAKLAATLGEHKQFLPLAVPFYERATIGGTLASGVDSPLRQMYGTARDFVLGMEFVTGDGALAKSGGRVVKNVSGYDLHKLMLGATGSLGIMTRVNFKTFPSAAETRGWLAGFARAEEAFAFADSIRKSPLALQTLEIIDGSAAAIMGVALPIDQTEWSAAISAAGNERVLERSAGDLRSMSAKTNAAAFRALGGAAGTALLTAIREFPALIANKFTDGVIARVTTLPTHMAETVQLLKNIAAERGLPCAVFARGVGVIYFALLPAERNATTMTRLPQCAKEIVSAAGKNNNRGMILQSPLELKREMNVWGAPGEDFPLMQRVKQAFDPHGILAPGRFVGGL